MRKLLNNLRFRFSMTVVISFMILLSGVLPAWATVPGDIAAGLPLDKVIDNGLKAGLSIDTIIVVALDNGVEPFPIIRAALARGVDLIWIFRLLTDYCQNTLTGPRKNEPKWCEACTVCSMMKCAFKLGRDPIEIANAMMAIGADLSSVRDCLGSMGVHDATAYTYTPPGPPTNPIGPNFHGGGVVSPSS